MDELKEAIIKKIESAFNDMNAHAYNNYTDDSEYTLFCTVGELKWLYEELGGTLYE